MKRKEFLNSVKGSAADLRTKLSELKSDLMRLKFKKVSAPTQKPHLFKELRRNIARAETLLRQARQDSSKV